MKLKLVIKQSEIHLFKSKIHGHTQFIPNEGVFCDIKKIISSTGGDTTIFFRFSKDGLIIHNEYNENNVKEVIFAVKFDKNIISDDFICESKKPNCIILLKMLEGLSKFTSHFGTLHELSKPFMYLIKEEKAQLRLAHTVDQGISGETCADIEVIHQVDKYFFPNYIDRMIEIFIRLKEVQSIFDIAVKKDKFVTLKIKYMKQLEIQAKDLKEKVRVCLKVEDSGLKCEIPAATITFKRPSLPHGYEYKHVIEPKILKQLATISSLYDVASIMIIEENGNEKLVLNLKICTSEAEDSYIIKCEQQYIIPRTIREEDMDIMDDRYNSNQEVKENVSQIRYVKQ